MFNIDWLIPDVFGSDRTIGMVLSRIIIKLNNLIRQMNRCLNRFNMKIIKNNKKTTTKVPKT